MSDEEVARYLVATPEETMDADISLCQLMEPEVMAFPYQLVSGAA